MAFCASGDGHVSGVHPITAAKVPILKVVDCGTKIECDISVENRDGVSKSKIIHMICSLDERFQKLSFLVKFCSLVCYAICTVVHETKLKFSSACAIVWKISYVIRGCAVAVPQGY